MTFLRMILLTLVAIAATAVVFTRDPRRQVLVYGFFGLLLTLLFFALESADVALSELVVSTVALPALILLALTKMRQKPKGK